MKQTFKVPTSKMDWVKARVAKLNKRASKHSLPGLYLTVTGTHVERIVADPSDPHSQKIWVEYTDYTVEGETPIIKGWEFIGRIDHVDGHNITLSVPGCDTQIPDEFKDRAPFCDHCRTHRLKKKSYIITRDGEFMQIGSACLKEFFDRPVEQQVHRMSVFDDIDQMNQSWGFNDFRQPLMTSLAVAAASIRQFGFQKSDSENPTKQDVITWFSRVGWQHKEHLKPTVNDRRIARKTVKWVRQQKANSEFMQNLQAFTTMRYVDLKYAGFLAAAVNSFLRSEAEKKEKEVVDSHWVGNIKQRLDLDLTLQRMIIRENEGHYAYAYVPNYTYIHIWVDDDGNRFVWFGSKIISDVPGERVSVRGTVKDHSEYKGIKNTVLTRVVAKGA